MNSDTRPFLFLRHVFDPAYEWIATQVTTDTPPMEVISRILEILEPDGIDNVYESSVWAVCMLYTQWKTGGHHLNSDEYEYACRRGGILGMDIERNITVTLRSILMILDPSFQDARSAVHHGRTHNAVCP